MTGWWPLDTAALLPAVLVGLAGAATVAAIRPPLPRLAPRLRPYNNPNRVRLGQPADVGGEPDSGALSGGAFRAVYAPMLSAAATALGRLADDEGDEQLARRLRHAGFYPALPAGERVVAYRKRRLAVLAASMAVAAVPGLLAGSAGVTLALLAAGGLFGVARPRAELDKAIQRRRHQMTVDLYTVDQHLAQLLDTGCGVDEALQRLTRRGRGPVVAELAEALTWRRAGMPLPEALRTLAAHTPEDQAGRTYKALATAASTGGGMGESLRQLGEDVRHSRRDAIQRLAIKRRRLMIAPIVVLLGPPLVILFLAPLSAGLFGGL